MYEIHSSLSEIVQDPQMQSLGLMGSRATVLADPQGSTLAEHQYSLVGKSSRLLYPEALHGESIDS